MKNIALTVHVEVPDDTDTEALGQEVFDFLADDPDNLFPAITAVVDFTVREVP